MQGERSNEEKIALEAKIKDLNDDLDQRNNTHTLLTLQLKRLQVYAKINFKTLWRTIFLFHFSLIKTSNFEIIYSVSSYKKSVLVCMFLSVDINFARLMYQLYCDVSKIIYFLYSIIHVTKYLPLVGISDTFSRMTFAELRETWRSQGRRRVTWPVR